MEGIVVVAVFVILVLVTISLGVRIVPQGSKNVVQRLGKYHKTLGPGLNIILPYIDRVAYKVTTKDIVLDIPSQDVITRDNAVIVANAPPISILFHPKNQFMALRTIGLPFKPWSKPRCAQLSVKWISMMRCHPGTKSRPN